MCDWLKDTEKLLNLHSNFQQSHTHNCYIQRHEQFKFQKLFLVFFPIDVKVAQGIITLYG